MSKKIAVVPGDGIGQEVIAEGLRIITALTPHIELETFDLGADHYLQTGETLPDAIFDRWKNEFDCIYLGALGDPRVPSNIHARDILLGARFRLDLYVNLRPIRLLHPDYCPLKNKGCEDINFVVFRENTEGLYTGIGGQFKKGTLDEIAIEQEMNTRKGVERIIRAAFEYTDQQGLTKMCMADKSNAMRHGHDLWQRVYKMVAAEYPNIESRHLYVDVLTMEMVRCPEQFEVIVTNNLFGDIVTDLGAILQGGIGLASSGNIHPNRLSLFEPVHGSAPTIAGKGIANPLAAILTVGMMYTHMGYLDLEPKITAAVKKALENKMITPELGGTCTTQQVGDAVLSYLLQ
jgi:3-isopropylmalate dehydrogenase